MNSISKIALNNTVYDIEDKEIRNTISTNPSLEENLSENMYAWTHNSTTYFTKESTPTTSSKLYTMPSSNTFVESTTSEIKTSELGIITIKEDKDYQAWTYNGNTYYTLGENPQVGDTLYVKNGTNFEVFRGLKITEVSSNNITLDQNEITITLIKESGISATSSGYSKPSLAIFVMDSNEGGYEHSTGLHDIYLVENEDIPSSQTTYTANLESGSRIGIFWGAYGCTGSFPNSLIYNNVVHACDYYESGDMYWGTMYSSATENIITVNEDMTLTFSKSIPSSGGSSN